MEIELVAIGRLPDETLIQRIKERMYSSLKDIKTFEVIQEAQDQDKQLKLSPFNFNHPFHNAEATMKEKKTTYSIHKNKKINLNLKVPNNIKIREKASKPFEINITIGEPINLNPLSYDEKKGGRLTETLYNDLWQRLSKTNSDLIAGFIDAKLLNKTFKFYENMYARYEDRGNGKGGAIISIKELYNENRLKSVDRIVKALLHEIGHSFDLNHCQPPCVMADAKSIEKLDEHQIYFCEKCKTQIKNHIRKEKENQENSQNEDKNKYNVSFSTLGLSKTKK